MRCTVVHGGVRITPQIDRLKRGVDVLVATPGRLLDLAGYRHLNLSRVEYLIFDEADRMLDLGFDKEISQILDLMPTERIAMLFSATYTSQVRKLAGKMLQHPKFIEITPGKTAAESVVQKVCLVERVNKRDLLIHLIRKHNWPRVLVFCRTKHGADKLTQKLSAQGIHADVLHGNKRQPSRSRILADFKKGQIRVLVATDVAARGLDILDLPVVVNYNIPHIPEDYVHRIGRTGRAGAKGVAISLVSHDDKSYLRGIENLLKQKIRLERVDGYTIDSDVPDFVLFRPNSPSSETKADPSIKALVAKRNISKSQKRARKIKATGSTKFVRPKSISTPGRKKDKGQKRLSRSVSRSPLSSNSGKTKSKRQGK
jgi:ATP-dependent RNA helicase RhlE